ncbi:MAG: hypothetical protein ABS944_03270 [Solibacillus sp.]|uniref:hypothetical protein n=1 Tax=unclassified Solibacillus TaxID=2637870 RepID=UPI0030F4C220
MKKRIVSISFIAVYLFVLPLNVIPAIKHPDTTIEMTHFISSLIFIIACLILSVLYQNLTSILSLGGMIAGIVIFILTKIEWLAYEYAVLDVIQGIVNPLYIVFVVPLFGINYWFDVRYEMFSIGTSLFYLLLFAFSLFKKWTLSNRR